MATVGAGSFTERSGGALTVWQFLDSAADTPGAEGWRKAVFKLKLNKVKDISDGRNVPIAIDPSALGAPPIRFRQTFRIGDDCATSVITCKASGDGMSLKCSSLPPP
jgi:hypothetical protein